MVKTYESKFPPSPNLDKVTVSFDKLNNTDLFLQIHGDYIVHMFKVSDMNTLVDSTYNCNKQ